MDARLVCRRALAAAGIGVMTIVATGTGAAAVELPPVSVPDITVPSLPPVTDVTALDAPVVVATTAPAATVAPPPPPPTSTTTSPVVASVPAAPPVVPVAPDAAAAPAPFAAPPDEPAVTPPPAAAEVSPPLRTVASERARQFAFPFLLALLIIGFLALQHRVGRRDPRLAAAPVDDDARGFQ